jgi:hypothetical protein
VYTRIFETFIEEEPPPFLKGLTTAPRPYVFEPADDTMLFAAGDPLRFDLLLFGQAIELHPYVLLALERSAAAGLGRERFPFVVDEALALPPGPPPEDGLPGSGLTLRLLTPTRIKINDRVAEPLPFRALAFAMLRRTLEMAHFHVPGAAVDWNFRPLLDLAAAVRVTQADLAWRDWARYSNRQKTKIEMGGYVGTLHLEGDLKPFLPLLRTAEILHIGKGATFGLGRLAVSAARPCATMAREDSPS